MKMSIQIKLYGASVAVTERGSLARPNMERFAPQDPWCFVLQCLLRGIPGKVRGEDHLFLCSRAKDLLQTTVTPHRVIDKCKNKKKKQTREPPHRSMSIDDKTIQHQQTQLSAHTERRKMHLCQRRKHR